MWIRIDSCLDHGGRWNYNCDTCEYSLQLENNQNINEIEMIQVLYGPSMHYPASIIYNSLSRSILLQKSVFAYEIPPPPEFQDNYCYVHSFVPMTRYYKINPTSQEYFQDSVIANLTPLDFQDRNNNGVIDGIGGHIIFYFSNDSIIEINLINDFTENQKKIMTVLLDLCLEYERDSSNQAYLSTLLKYF